jgi:hypothetical protein
MVSSSQDAFAKRICSLSSATLRELLLFSDYKFATRLLDAFLLTQPTLTFIQKILLCIGMWCASCCKTRWVWGMFSAAQKDMRRVHDRDVGFLSTKYVWSAIHSRIKPCILPFSYNQFCDLSKILRDGSLCGEPLVFQKIRLAWACLRLLKSCKGYMIEILAPRTNQFLTLYIFPDHALHPSFPTQRL